MKTVLISFVFTFIFGLSAFANADVYSIEINNLEDANNNYPLAIYYKELATSSKSVNEAQENALIAKYLLEKIVVYLPIKDVYLDLASLYEVFQDYDESINIYEDLTQIYYNDDSIFSMLAERYLFLKADTVKARYYFEKAFEINKNNNNAIIMLGFLAYENNNYNMAVDYFSLVDQSKGIIANHLINYDFYYAVSEFYTSRIESANKRLESINANYLSEPDKVTAAFILIKTYQALEDYDKAYEVSIYNYNLLNDERFLFYAVFFNFLSGNFDDDLFKSLYSEGYNLSPIVNIINIAKTESYEDALNIVEVEFERGNVDLDMVQIYYYLSENIQDNKNKEQLELDIITFYLKLNLYESVEPHLEKLLSYSTNKNYMEFYLSLADYYYANEYYEKTEYLIKKYTEITNKSNEYIQFFLVNMYVNKTFEYDKAISILKESDSVSFREAYMSYIYYKTHDYENAKVALNKYYDLSKEDLESFETYYNLSYSVAFALRDKEMSLKYTEIFLEEEPNNIGFMNNHAWALIELDIDVDAGINMVTRALEKDPTDEYKLDTLARGYYKKGDYSKALEYFFKALLYSTGSNNVEIFQHIGDVYYKIGKNENALYYYRRVRTAKSEDELFDFDYVEKQIDILTKE